MSALVSLRLLGLVLLAAWPAIGCNAADADPAAKADGGSSGRGSSAAAGRTGAADAGGPKPFDPGTFSGEHEAEIRKDCNETIQCQAQQGRELPDDPLETCLNAGAEILDRETERQASFLAKVARCESFVVCDYLNCVSMNAAGWGDSQRAKVTHDCEAHIECLMDQGTFTGDRTAALQGCVATRTGVLDAFNAMQRQQYEDRYASCMDLTGCEFTACFKNGM
jgi:hypothetical protein